MSINATLFGQMITFFLFIWFTMRFVWPKLISAIEEREKEVKEGLAAAERGRHELETAERRVVEMLEDARKKVKDILESARENADSIIRRAKTEAEKAKESILLSSETEVLQKKAQAREALRSELSGLVVLAVNKILEQESSSDLHAKQVATVLEELSE